MTTNIQQIAISKLEASPLNMRKSQATKTENAQLKASIKAHGVKQNLIVFPSTKTKYGVVAGGRRLSQVLELVKEKHLKKSDTLPCTIAESEQEAIELSIVENTHRAAASPADEFEAYQAAKTSGATIKGIADRFGVTQKHVKQRLKLAALAPAIIDKLRSKDLSLDAAIAFTLTDNQEKQLEVLQALQHNNFGIQPHAVRRALTEEKIDTNHKAVKFIGLPAYRKAGGTVTTDLFSNENYLNDPGLAIQLAEDKLKALAEENSQGWLWSETYIDLPDHNYIWNMLNIHGIKCTDLVELEKNLSKELWALQDKEYNEDNFTEADQKLSDELEQQLSDLEDEIEETKAFIPEEMALAGLIIVLDHNGKPEFHMGRVRTSERPALKALQNQNKVTTDGNQPTPSTAEQIDPGFSQTLTDDLAATRKVIAQANLARHPQLAMDLLHYNLCHQILKNHPWGAGIDARFTKTFDADRHPTVTTCEGFGALQKIGSKLNRDWIHTECDRERFQAFQQLDNEHKEQLIAYCTALTLEVSLTNRHTNKTSEEVIKQLDISWQSYWNPTKDNFLGRINRPAMIEIASPFLPKEWPAQAEKKKKADLAQELEHVFDGSDERLSGEQANEAFNWLPPGFKGEAA